MSDWFDQLRGRLGVKPEHAPDGAAPDPEALALSLPEAEGEPIPTHIVELPATVSAAGLRQSLLGVSGGRVALVVPWDADGLAHSGLVSFQVLRRQAETQGVPVAIVTTNARVRELAAETGLPTFRTVEGAQTSPWHFETPFYDYQPPPPRRNGRQAVSVQRRSWLAGRFRRVTLEQGSPRPMPAWLEAVVLALFLLAAVAVLASVVAFIVPVATVTLVPAQAPVTASVTVTARSDVEVPDPAKNIIPARRIGQRVEGGDTIEATGSASAADQLAQGAVVFTNRGLAPQQIPAGTVVATSTGANVRFQTLAPAEVPGGVGARVAVPIEALEPGPAGNVRAGTINTIEGPLAPLLNVINTAGTGGGNVKQVTVVTQGDKDRLRSRLEQQVIQKSYGALSELLQEGEFVPPETIGTIVVDETYDRFVDEQADQVSLRLRLLATALAVDGNAANELAFKALGDAIPRRGRLLADTVSYATGPATVTQLDDGTTLITFDVTASGQAVLDIDPSAVRAAIRGLRPEEAVAKLEQDWRLQTKPEITLGPDWVLPILRRWDFDWLPLAVADRVPWLPFRTHVRVVFAPQ